MENSKWLSKGAIVGYSLGGAAIVSAGVVVPLVVASTKDNPAQPQDSEITKESLGITFSGESGFGTISRTFDDPNIQITYSKATNLKNGENLVVTLTGLNGHTINGKTTVAFDYIVSGLTETQVVNNITLNQSDLGITFSGFDTAGQLAYTFNNANIDLSFDKTTNLKNNDIVTATLVAHEGYTINNKLTESFEFPVTGLDRNLSLQLEDLGISYSGFNGSATASVGMSIPEALEVTLSKSDNLSTGDQITVTVTAKTGYAVNGKDVETFVVNVPTLTNNILLTQDQLGVTFATVNNDGVVSATYSNQNITIAFSKTDGIRNGDEVVATLIPRPGFAINGKSSETFTYTASGISIYTNIVMTADDIDVQFTGIDPNGTATATTSVEHVTLSVSPSSGLSNGMTVEVTVTPETGYRVNGQTSFVFYKNVGNALDTNITLNGEDLGVSYTGLNGAGQLQSSYSNENLEIVFDKTNNLSNGDVVVATVTAKPGYKVNGKDTETLNIVVTGIPQNISLTQDMLGVSSTGISGQGTLEMLYTNPNLDINISKTTGLTNGENVVITVTAKPGYKINGQDTYVFNYSVLGLLENISINTDTINSYYSGFDGEGIVYSDFSHSSLIFSIDKISLLSNGEVISITVTAETGYLINGQPSITFQRTVSGLDVNTQMSSTDIPLEFSGASGSGSVVSSYSNPNYDISIDQTSGLINGQTIKVTITGKNGYFVNYEKSFDFFYEVGGLDIPYTIDQNTLGLSFTGVDGEGTFTSSYTNPNVDVSFDNQTGLTTGDIITVTLTPYPGAVVNGSKEPTTIQVTVPRLWVFKISSQNGEYNSLQEAKDALIQQSTKAQVYVVEGVEYLNKDQALNQYLVSHGNTITGPFIYANTNLPTGNPDHIDGTLVSELGPKITNSTEATGYEFGGKIYFDLDEARNAWLATQTNVPAINGSATVQVTNPNFPGSFSIPLDTATADHVDQIISKLSWTSPVTKTIAGANSNYNIAFNNLATTAYMTDPVTSQQVLSYNKSVLFSNTPTLVNGYTLTQTVAPAISAPYKLPLTFYMKDSTGVDRFYAGSSSSLTVDKEFPTMVNGVYYPGTMSDTDLAVVFNLFKTYNPISVNSPTAGKVSIRWYDKTDTNRTTVINQPAVGTADGLPVGWETLDYNSTSTTNTNLVKAKAALVRQMAKDGLISNVTNYRTQRDITRGQYDLTLTLNTNPSSTQVVKVMGPADGTALTAADFNMTITGGTSDEYYDDRHLVYNGTIIPSITSTIRKNLQTDSTTAPVITSNDLIVTVNSLYVPEKVWTVEDAPAIDTWTYLPENNPTLLPGSPILLADFDSDNRTYSGYIFYDISEGIEKFYNTYDNATHAAIADFDEDVLPVDSQSYVIWNGVIYDSFDDLFSKVIYISTSSQTPTLMSVNSRAEDIYELIY